MDRHKTFRALVNPEKPAKCSFCGDKLPEGIVEGERVIVVSVYLMHLEKHGIIRRRLEHDTTVVGRQQGYKSIEVIDKSIEVIDCCCGDQFITPRSVVEHLDPTGAHVAECAMLVAAGHGFKAVGFVEMTRAKRVTMSREVIDLRLGSGMEEKLAAHLMTQIAHNEIVRDWP